MHENPQSASWQLYRRPEVESHLLGAIILDPPRYAAIRDIVSVTDFAPGPMRDLYCAMVTLAEDGVEINTVNIADRMRSDATFEKAGAPASSQDF